VIAGGRLGAGDVGYGSDLDVLFIYDPEAAPPGSDPPEHFTRLAQRIVRLFSEPHAAGQGYDLDTRLRPSGSHGLLVTSLGAFARYHGVSPGAETETGCPQVLSSGAAWERQALLRARPVAGDLRLGEECVRIAHQAAYERGAASAGEVHALRMRMERELGRERAGRADLKLGKGGLMDVEFSVQWLQMRHGKDERVRTTDTVGALHALTAAGYLSREHFETLRDGYVFLRRLEARIRVVHGKGTTLLDGAATGMDTLARRMGIARTAQKTEGEALFEAYLDVTTEVRRAYLAVLGVS
jgi:glutamate-ammonia-ligase adenylyltransferase